MGRAVIFVPICKFLLFTLFDVISSDVLFVLQFLIIIISDGFCSLSFETSCRPQIGDNLICHVLAIDILINKQVDDYIRLALGSRVVFVSDYIT